MAIGPIATQRAWLRRAVGHQTDTALVTDDLLDDALDAALLEVNRHWPLKTVGSFSTVKDQQTYSVLPAGAYRVLEVYYPVPCGDAADWWPDFRGEVDSLLYSDEDEQGFVFPTEPALALAYDRFQTYFRRFDHSGYRLYPPGTVRLIPAPGSTGEDVYFLYSTPRYATVEDMAEEHQQAYEAAAQAQLHGVLATGRGALTDVRSPLGVSVRTRASMAHTEAAKRWDAKFRGLLPVLRTSRGSP